MPRAFAKIRRLRDITAVVVRHGLGHYIKHRRAAGASDLRHSLPNVAHLFRDVLEELGPTFIKLGQMLSTRADILPEGFAQVLSGLQDNCAPLPIEQIHQAILQGFGQPVDVLYKQFSATPLASASIAQVHEAQLFSGEHVVVKIRRPHIREKILEDMDLLRFMAQLADNIIQESGFSTSHGVACEFEHAFLSELNFLHEADMMRRFKKNIGDGERSYCVPDVFLNLSCDSIITMSYMQGVRLDMLQPQHDPAQIANHMMLAAFDQMFVDGLFHADPHPGNCLVLPDNRLALLDFGSVGHISYAMRETLLILVVSIGMRDADAVARMLYRVGIAEHHISLHDLRDACAALFEQYLHHNQTLSGTQATRLLKDLFEVAARFHIAIPHEYALVARAAMILEGNLRKLDSNLKIIDIVRPMMRRLLEKQFTWSDLGDSAVKNLLRTRGLIRDLPTSISQILMDLEYGRLSVQVNNPAFDTIARNIDTLGLIIFMGLIISALIGGSLFVLGSYHMLSVPIAGLFTACVLFFPTLGAYLLRSRLRKLSLGRFLK